MRIRTRALLAGFGIALVGAVALATPAGAETVVKPKFTHESASHCFDLLAGNKDATVDDCQKAPSPLRPATNEIIWGSAAFAVLLLAMWKWGIPAVKNMEKAREDRIRNDLETAERARTDAESAAAQYRSQIGDARGEAARIIDEARQAADGVAREIRARAESEAAELRTRAAEETRLQTERAMTELRQAVASMSVELASKIVERNIDASTQQQLIDSYISSVGRSN